jgi:hypothetical protein
MRVCIVNNEHSQAQTHHIKTRDKNSESNGARAYLDDEGGRTFDWGKIQTSFMMPMVKVTLISPLLHPVVHAPCGGSGRSAQSARRQRHVEGGVKFCRRRQIFARKVVTLRVLLSGLPLVAAEEAETFEATVADVAIVGSTPVGLQSMLETLPVQK